MANQSKHPLYATWYNMWRRCVKETDKGYPNYGGRGIKVCKRWISFEQFAKDMGPKPSAQHTLERKNNTKGYSPSNCIWATRTEQCLNRRVFKNSASGSTGVVKKDNSWLARYDHSGVRYNIGWYEFKEDAERARNKFVRAFKRDPVKALSLLPKDRSRFTSQTKDRGVNPHVDGGYMARCTIKGTRYYVGYFQTLKEAVAARARFIAGQTRTAEN